MELHDPEILSNWLNDFIKFVDVETISLMVENMRGTIANRIRDIEYTIASKRKLVKQRRKDQIKEIEYTYIGEITGENGLKLLDQEKEYSLTGNPFSHF